MKRFLSGCAGVIATVVVLSILHCASPNSHSNSDKCVPCDSTNVGYFDIVVPQSGDSMMMSSRDWIIFLSLIRRFCRYRNDGLLKNVEFWTVGDSLSILSSIASIKNEL